MILTVDIGNTETVLGLFEGRAAVQVWRVATERDRTADEISGLRNRWSFPADMGDPSWLGQGRASTKRE